MCSAFLGMLFVDSKEPSQTLLSNSSPVISPNVVIIQKMLTQDTVVASYQISLNNKVNLNSIKSPIIVTTYYFRIILVRFLPLRRIAMMLLVAFKMLKFE